MSSTAFDTKRAAAAPDVIATDGSEVRVLCATARGSTARFTLSPGMVSRAVAHRTLDEIWYVTQGRGRMWRQLEGREEIAEIAAGVSVSIPPGTHFQFRNDGDETLEAVAVAMPPWPGDGEACLVAGKWLPIVPRSASAARSSSRRTPGRRC
jgi:mannose-6-phosphate isomerase-like protein (cupin superfamily)